MARAASALPEKEVKLIVVGGDGTINEVLNGIGDFERVSLGIVPMGSGNDFVRGVGLPRTPRAAMNAIYHAKTRRLIDLGEVRMRHVALALVPVSAWMHGFVMRWMAPCTKRGSIISASVIFLTACKPYRL